MNRRWEVLLVRWLAIASCQPRAANAPAPAAEGRRFGDVMTEVGRRFERAGRAVAAGRWELADYDVGEIGEAFEQDVPHATPPAELHVDLQPLARAFAAAYPAELHRAIAARDRSVFQAAYARAAAACNGCHSVASKAFIEVPTVLGAEVPTLSPAAGAPTPSPSPSDH